MQRRYLLKRTILFTFLFILFLTVAVPVAAQGPTVIQPGASLTVTCATGMSMTIVNAQTLRITCASSGEPMATRTATPTRTPVAAATPTPTPVVGTPTSGPVSVGIWTSARELAGRPMSGAAWQALKAAADGSLGSPNIADQDSRHDVKTLAVALVYARTGLAPYRAKAAQAILTAIGTEAGGRTLALGRNLVGYVIAADLIKLGEYDPAGDQRFRAWLSAVRRSTLDGKTLISTHEDRPNNWGTHAGASRVAVDLYLGDTADLARAWKVFQGWTGNRAAYAGFKYGDLSWQCDSAKPVGVNGACASGGHNLDGALPDDMRRGGSYTWPPGETGYAWEAMQGAVVQAVLLERAGFPALQEQNQAILRAAQFLSRLDQEQGGWWAEGDDSWQPYLLNAVYNVSFPTGEVGKQGKGMAWEWVFGR